MKQGRGIDFEHRFNASRWAEDRLFEGLSKGTGLVSIRFGLSEVRAAGKITYDKSGHKEPDLIVLPSNKLSQTEVKQLQDENFDLSNLDRDRFQKKGDLNFVIKKALAAFEAEFSPYRASEMKGRKWKPKTSEQWNKRPLKHANAPNAPNIWVKEEDLSRLCAWESEFGVPIIVAQVFDQEAFAVALNTVEKLAKQLDQNPDKIKEIQMTGGIFKKIQSYDRIDAQGAGEKKTVFLTTPAAAIKVGDVLDVTVKSSLGISKSQKYVSQIIFEGGNLALTAEFKSYLQSLNAAN